MKLLDGLALKGRPAEIPDCSRDDLPQFFKDLGFEVGAEVGVLRGDFSKKIAEKGFKFFAVDPWLHNDSQFEQTKSMLSIYPNASIIRETSMSAVSDFEADSLDFVYIDANHEFRHVADDLYEWTKRVRKGGIVAGHDYFYTRPGTTNAHWHVAHVLNAYTAAYGITNWYVLGSRRPKEGEIRDRWRSWMFVKP